MEGQPLWHPWLPREVVNQNAALLQQHLNRLFREGTGLFAVAKDVYVHEMCAAAESILSESHIEEENAAGVWVANLTSAEIKPRHSGELRANRHGC